MVSLWNSLQTSKFFGASTPFGWEVLCRDSASNADSGISTIEIHQICLGLNMDEVHIQFQAYGTKHQSVQFVYETGLWACDEVSMQICECSIQLFCLFWVYSLKTCNECMNCYCIFRGVETLAHDYDLAFKWKHEARLALIKVSLFMSSHPWTWSIDK